MQNVDKIENKIYEVDLYNNKKKNLNKMKCSTYSNILLYRQTFILCLL